MPRSSAPSSASNASPRWRPSCARGAPASCASRPCRRWPTASCRASSGSSCRTGRSSTSCCRGWCRMPWWRRSPRGSATWASPRPRWSMPPSSASSCRRRPSSRCCRERHRLARKKKLRPRDFEGENFISLGPSTLSRFRIDRMFAEHGITRILRIETPLSEIACALAGVRRRRGAVRALHRHRVRHARHRRASLRAADRLRVRGALSCPSQRAAGGTRVHRRLPRPCRGVPAPRRVALAANRSSRRTRRRSS